MWGIYKINTNNPKWAEGNYTKEDLKDIYTLEGEFDTKVKAENVIKQELSLTMSLKINGKSKGMTLSRFAIKEIK